MGSVPNLSPISLNNGLMEVKIIFCCVVITVNLLLENMLACVAFSLYRMPILNIKHVFSFDSEKLDGV